MIEKDPVYVTATQVGDQFTLHRTQTESLTTLGESSEITPTKMLGVARTAYSDIRVSVPMEAMLVEASFEGVDPDVVAKVKEGYGAGGATPDSAGLDLRYVGKEPLVLKPGETKLIHTGIAIHINNYELVGIIAPRSGKGNEGLVLGNLIGVIDSDYQGELLVSLWNRNEIETGKEFVIEPGERIAQYFVVHRYSIGLSFVESFGPKTQRASGGFGHTGRF